MHEISMHPVIPEHGGRVMSNEKGNSWLLSEDQLIEWLSLKNRTYGWSALVMYDRTKANLLLAQEYIDRFSRDEQFDPITDRVQTADGVTQVWEYLYDHVLGPPLLSFEVSEVFESWVRLTMPIMGGVQMTVEQSAGTDKNVTRLSWYDPLQGPSLIAELQLEDSDGSVVEDNRVKLNLQTGVNFRLTFASTVQQQKKGGAFYKEKFDALDDDRKYFVMNTLEEFAEGEFLNPDRFRIRSLSAEPRRSMSDEGAVEGAVLVFVAGTGSDSGSLPDIDDKWVYPIPAGRTSTMLIDNSLVMKHLLGKGIQSHSGESESDFQFSYDSEGGVVVAVNVSNGNVFLTRAFSEPVLGSGTCFLHVSLNPMAGGKSQLSIRREGEGIVISWVGIPATGYEAPVALIREENEFGHGALFSIELDVEGVYAFSLDDDGNAKLARTGEGRKNIKLTLNDIDSELVEHVEQVKVVARAGVQAIIERFFDEIMTSTSEIDLFRLHGILFRGARTVEHRAVRWPLDMAMFGDISPERTSFEVIPMQKDVAAGQLVAFTTAPPQAGLTWSVGVVPGYPGGVGSIDQSGRFTAPGENDFPGVYTMVRVTASKDGQSTTALARVVTRGVAVNPIVAAISPNGGKVRLSGGTLDGGTLTWTISSETGATLTSEPPSDGGDFEPTDMFYVPGASPSGKPFSIDIISAENLRTGQVANAYLLVLEQLVGAQVSIDDSANMPDGQVRLILTASAGPIEGVSWSLLAGSGSVDANGIYTTDPASKEPFAVITGEFEIPNVIRLNGYIILPVPLVDLEDFRRAVS